MRRATGAVVAVALGAIASEVAHLLATTPTPRVGSKPVVLLLGFPSRRDGAPHPVQRWRAGLAVRTAKAYRSEGLIVTGGFTRGPRSEADLLASLVTALAAEAGKPITDIALEEAATTTWENVLFSRELLGADESVVIVSDPLHAARARRYWLKQSPGDQHRVFVSGCCGLFDGWWLKGPTAIVEILRWLKVRFVNPAIPEPASS